MNQHMDQYNTKLILSCLKQTTPTLEPVTTTGTTTPEEADGAEEALATEVVAVAETIAETHYAGGRNEMKTSTRLQNGL